MLHSVLETYYGKRQYLQVRPSCNRDLRFRRTGSSASPCHHGGTILDQTRSSCSFFLLKGSSSVVGTARPILFPLLLMDTNREQNDHGHHWREDVPFPE